MLEKLKEQLGEINKYNVEVINSQEGIELLISQREWLKRKGFEGIDDIAKEFYEYNGVGLYWRYKENNKIVGEYSIPSLGAIFNLGWEDKLWFDLSADEGLYIKEYDTFCRNLYGMDAMEESYDNKRIAAFYVDKTKINPKEPLNPDIWIYNANDAKYLITLKFEQYLEKLLITKGFFGWQLFYLDWDRMDFKDPMIKEWLFPFAPSTKPMEEFLEYMPKIFPDQDYTEFKLLYDNWIKKAKEKGFAV